MLPLKLGVLEPAANSGHRKTSRLSKEVLSKEVTKISDGRGRERGGIRVVRILKESGIIFG